MSEPMYDFRDGILLEKIVYKDDSCNCQYLLLYIACLLLTWIWGCGWFALFFYSYVFHERVAFIVFLVIWCIFAAIIIVIGFLTIQKSKKEKIRKQTEKELKERQLKQIAEAKRRRNENRRTLNNDDEINTNIDHHNDNYFESNRGLIIETNNDFINEEPKY